MADYTWINVPPGSRLELRTSGTRNYGASADVAYQSQGLTPAAYTIQKPQLDPGPASIALVDGGVTSVTIRITFVSTDETTVTVRAEIKKPDGTRYGAPFEKDYTSSTPKQVTCVLMVKVESAA